jgi:hypothetical protein
VVHEHVLDQFPVGNHHVDVVGSADPRGPHRDVGHLPVLVLGRDVLADLKRLVPEDQKPRDRVGQRILSGEADRDADDPDTRQRRADVDAELAGGHDETDGQDRELVKVVHEQLDQCLGEAGAAKHGSQGGAGDLHQEPEDEHDEDSGDDLGRELHSHPAQLLGVEKTQDVGHGSRTSIPHGDVRISNLLTI